MQCRGSENLGEVINMTENQRRAGIGVFLLIAAIALSALFVTSPRLTAEANMRYASDTAEAEDPDMAELLMLLNEE